MNDMGRILVVDDTPSSLKLLTELLQEEGYQVRSAISGALALRAAKISPPDLLLLDIRMPDMDGYEVFRQLKAEPETQGIPVIFVSAASETDDKLAGFELGAVDYVTKPFQRAELLARVHTHLELSRTRIHLAKLLDEQTKIKAQVLEQFEYVSKLNLQLEKTYKQLKDAQDQLVQAEKMAAIGLLAAGVAHEINNPISYVNSNLGTLEQYQTDIVTMLDKYQSIEAMLEADHPALEELRKLKSKLDLEYIRNDATSLIAESRQGLERVKEIVLELKNFSRIENTDRWEWIDIQRVLDSALNIVYNELKHRCQVVREYGVLPKIYCLPTQLNQVVLNLLVNASQAIETNGTITIRTGQDQQDVWFEVSDTGEGIPPENIPRLFDPFFTSKPVGKGTGLGLAVSYSIINKHHGKIDVNSEVGKGSTFRVWLPIEQSGSSRIPDITGINLEKAFVHENREQMS